MRHGFHRAARTAAFPVAALVLALAGIWAWGCGDGKTTVTPPIPTIEIRNGTWQQISTFSWSGHDSCTARGMPVETDTLVLCNIEVADLGFVVGEFTCPTLEMDGENVSYVCRLRVNEGVCYLIVEITGSGTITDSTFVLQNTFYPRFEPVNPDDQVNCDILFGQTVDACTTHVVWEGTFLDSTGSFNCPSDSAAAGIPLVRFLAGQAAAGEFEGP